MKLLALASSCTREGGARTGRGRSMHGIHRYVRTYGGVLQERRKLIPALSGINSIHRRWSERTSFFRSFLSTLMSTRTLHVRDQSWWCMEKKIVDCNAWLPEFESLVTAKNCQEKKKENPWGKLSVTATRQAIRLGHNSAAKLNLPNGTPQENYSRQPSLSAGYQENSSTSGLLYSFSDTFPLEKHRQKTIENVLMVVSRQVIHITSL